MFSGIVEEYATLVALVKDQENIHFTFKCSFVNELKIDQSISHNGVCLTVVSLTDDTYTVTAMKETLERSNLGLLKVGDKVEITPYASAAGVRQGSISEINPLVDENGMVRVKARVNGSNKLFDGMNVRVSVKRSVGEQLVIPKTAVVLRSGKQVVFTLKEGKAMWNYVHTGLENMEEYTVTDGLEEGMEVITTGNVNLAHEAPVRVIKN